jgi:hypothetical protein
MPYSKQMPLTASFLVEYFSFKYYHFKSLFMFTSLLYLTSGLTSPKAMNLGGNGKLKMYYAFNFVTECLRL